MKKLLPFFAVIALIGGGCTPSIPPTQPPQNEGPKVSTVGCTPKSMTILEPAPGATVTLPLTVKALVHNAEHPDCVWTVFEAQAASMRLLDENGATVGTGVLTATEDWMTDGPVHFKGEIPSVAVVHGATTLVITEENPSGQGTPEEISFPLTVN